jgi:hypothetical protein
VAFEEIEVLLPERRRERCGCCGSGASLLCIVEIAVETGCFDLCSTVEMLEEGDMGLFYELHICCEFPLCFWPLVFLVEGENSIRP